jgi:CheY-like chemotaxis protein
VPIKPVHHRFCSLKVCLCLPLECSNAHCQQGSIVALGAQSTAPLLFVGLRVLVDNSMNRIVCLRLLGCAKLSAEIAVNGRVALDMVMAKPYDLILMDCMMPEMDGYASTQAIRAHELAHQLPRVPIVALTANAMPVCLYSERVLVCGTRQCMVLISSFKTSIGLERL